MAKASITLKLAIALMSIAGFTLESRAQAPQAGDSNDARIEDLITASHMLAHEGILDSFGHVTVRSATDPGHFFMPRAMPPALVARADIVEVDLDCKPVTANAPRLNGERYIHCEIYKARADVQSVIHTHDLAVIPFGLTGTPLRPVVAQAGFLPKETPLFEVRDAYAPGAAERGMLVLNASLGKALAAKLGSNPVVLMRGHGETVVGRSVKEATVRTFYTNIDARAQAAAAAMGPNATALDDAELATNARENFDADRPWENYRQRMLKAQGQPH
ncbi:MAG TPA: class II aldolase/adducin family protein [Xanthobacteraceae bacterium]|jgi:HCOMODA/2-hydroxy-3-carboxy-muconic semialdehyde decarboxylase